jgi:hypothetical protein
MKYPFILYILLILSLSSSGQDYINLEAKGTAGIYSSSESPFWMHSNRRGRVDEKTFYSGLLSGSVIFNKDNSSSFQFGGGLLYKDGYDVKLTRHISVTFLQRLESILVNDSEQIFTRV